MLQYLKVNKGTCLPSYGYFNSQFGYWNKLKIINGQLKCWFAKDENNELNRVF